MGQYLPLSVNFHTSVATVGVAVLLSDADVLLATHTASWSAAVFFSDADVLACVAVVTTGRALLGVSITLTFPSSALDSYTLVSLDFGGVGSLLVVPVGRRKDAERDSVVILARNSPIDV
jgi:hypothetical protein